MRDIRAVLLTHAHLDHLGLAERIRREAGATVWVHERDALVTRDILAGRTGPAIVCAAFTHDTAQALASLDSLDSLAPLDAGLVLPGHGDPYEHGITQAVQLARHAGAA